MRNYMYKLTLILLLSISTVAFASTQQLPGLNKTHYLLGKLDSTLESKPICRESGVECDAFKVSIERRYAPSVDNNYGRASSLFAMRVNQLGHKGFSFPRAKDHSSVAFAEGVLWDSLSEDDKVKALLVDPKDVFNWIVDHAKNDAKELLRSEVRVFNSLAEPEKLKWMTLTTENRRAALKLSPQELNAFIHNHDDEVTFDPLTMSLTDLKNNLTILRK